MFRLYSLKFFALFLLTIFFLSCGGSKDSHYGECVSNSFNIIETDDSESVVEPSRAEQIEAYLFVDATSSMKGFVSFGTTSTFPRMLREIERGLIKGWRRSTINYYRFGWTFFAIDREEFINCSNPNFYSLGRQYDKTRLDNIFSKIDSIFPQSKQHGDTEYVAIVVTDLFQDKSDINNVIQKIKSILARKTYLSIGILALKGEFKGKVYDVSEAGYSFYYSSVPDSPQTFRPFYVLVIGVVSTINNFYQSIKDFLEKNIPESNRKFTVISNKILSSPLSFELLAKQDLDFVAEVRSIGNVSLKNLRHIKAYRIIKDNNLNRVPVLKFEFKFEPFSYACFSKYAETKIRIRKCDKTKNYWRDINNPTNIISGTTSINWDRKILTVVLKIDPNFLENESVYLCNVTFVPDVGSINDFDWVDEWDFSFSDNILSGESAFNGTKTYNLKSFLSSLIDLYMTTEEFEKNLSRIYFYLEVK